jgi:hypothetical protein
LGDHLPRADARLAELNTLMKAALHSNENADASADAPGLDRRERSPLEIEIRACRRLLEILVSISGKLLQELRTAREAQREHPQS